MAKAKKYRAGSVTLLGGNGRMPVYMKGGTGDMIGVDVPFLGPVRQKRRGRPRGTGSSRKLKRGPRGLKAGQIAIFDDVGMTVLSGGSGARIGRQTRSRKGVGKRGVTAAEKRMLAEYAAKAGKRRTRRGGRGKATAAQLRALAYGRAVRAAKLGGRKRPAKPSAVGARARKGSYRAPANTQMISGDVKSAILELARRAKSAKKNMPGPVKTGLESLAKKVKQYHGRYC